MRMNKKRALIGYHPQAVQQFANSLQTVFEKEKHQLEAELAALISENIILAERVGELTKKVSKQLAFEREQSEQQPISHFEHVKKLVTAAPSEAKTSVDLAETSSSDVLSHKQKQAY
jgi:hypothetical protein